MLKYLIVTDKKVSEIFFQGEVNKNDGYVRFKGGIEFRIDDLEGGTDRLAGMKYSAVLVGKRLDNQTIMVLRTRCNNNLYTLKEVSFKSIKLLLKEMKGLTNVN